MKKIKSVKKSSVLLIGLGLALAQQVNAETKIGVGYQTTAPAYGLAATYAYSDKLDVQGVLGLLGTYNGYSVRGLYDLGTKGEKYTTYGYGTLGLFSYTGRTCGTTGSVFSCSNKTQTTLGFGAGVGLKVNWQEYDADLPPLFWNIEIGFSRVKFSDFGYNTFPIAIGGGLTYYLDI